MDLQGKTVLIVGAGKSGIAAGELLRKKGIAYRLYDGNKELSKEELQKNDIWKDCGIILGELPTEILADTGLAVLSPGVPTDLPVICSHQRAGDSNLGRNRAGISFCKRQTSCNYRNKWKDYNNIPVRRDYAGIF